MESNDRAITKRSKPKILIVDDTEFNREILIDMLEEKYDLTEAGSGFEAVAEMKEHAEEYSLVLLDIVMPEMDGFEVLAMMNRYHWIDDLPVIMISSETAPSYIHRAYDLGASDYISRPFDHVIVSRRVENTIMVNARQHRLKGMVEEQIRQREKVSNLMVSILSHIVEFRNGESGLHVMHVQVITETLLRRLMQITDRYKLNDESIRMIGVASALHDIGKISIPDGILNKPGRFTDEEYAIMKTHSAAGAQMLDNLPFYQDEPMVKLAYEICRWHHERWDGRGYPDGLKGDEIPITAQVVAVADVYDALTSERCYKKAFTHEKAMEMILNGECGEINPLLLQCLRDVGDELQEELKVVSIGNSRRTEQKKDSETVLNAETTGRERERDRYKLEQMKVSFLSQEIGDIIFYLDCTRDVILFNETGATRLRMKNVLLDPKRELMVPGLFPDGLVERIANEIRSATPERSDAYVKGELLLDGANRPCQIHLRVLWSESDRTAPKGVIGRVKDEDFAGGGVMFGDKNNEVIGLTPNCYVDGITKIYNKQYLEDKFATLNQGLTVVMADVNDLTRINREFGFASGDDVLRTVARELTAFARGASVARVGGDEFAIVLQNHPRGELEAYLTRLRAALTDLRVEVCPGTAISVSIGAVCADGTAAELLRRADAMAYRAKASSNGICIE